MKKHVCVFPSALNSVVASELCQISDVFVCKRDELSL